MSFVIRNKSAEFDEDKILRAKKLLESIPIPSVEKVEPIGVFISLCETEENLRLVEELIYPFLTTLGFKVHYYRRDVSFGIPKEQMESIMDLCEVIVGLYTRESYSEEKDEYFPAGNVVKEMGRDRPENKFIFYEEKVHVETLTFSEVPALPFRRNNYARLLLDLVNVLNNSKFCKIKASRKNIE